MTVMVTGAAGFIGSHLVDRLMAEGEKTVGVDDLSSGRLARLSGPCRDPEKRFKLERVDVTSSALAELIHRHRPTTIWHLAAQVDVRKSVADPIHDATVNVLGSLNLLNAAADAGTGKVVFASSGGAIYGEPPSDRLPVVEEEIYSPSSVPASPYAVGKKIVLDYLRYHRSERDLDFTALAFSNVYGPRQDPPSGSALEGQVVATFCRRMLEGLPCTIYGTGEQTRDFVFVSDVISALCAARESGSGELINIGSGQETSVNDLHTMLSGKIPGAVAPRWKPARAGEVQRSAVAIGKARRALGWEPMVSLDAGLEQTIDYFKATSA